MESHIASNFFNIFDDFKFNDVEIQIIKTIDCEIWFKAKDCALALEYIATKQAIRKNVKDKHKTNFDILNKNSTGVTQTPVDILDKDLPIRPQTVYINEAGLFSLILMSKQKEAEEF